MHSARRIARTSLLTGGMVAVALAVPAVSAAQDPAGPELPGGNGLIAVTTGGGTTTTIAQDGSGKTDMVNPPAGAVGWWSADNRLSFLQGTTEASFVDADVDFSTATPVFMMAAITGAAASPFGPDIAVASTDGLQIIGEGGTVTVTPDPVNRVAWSSEGAKGSLIFDGLPVDGQVIPGGGDLANVPSSGDTTGPGIWRYDVDSGQLMLLASDESAKNPTVSQDGNVIAWETTTVEGDTDIHYIDRREVGVPERTLLGQSPENETFPTVSPDGTKLVHFTTAGGPHVKIKGVSGDELGDMILYLDEEVTGIAWQPAVAADAGAPSISGTATVGSELTIGGTDATGTAPLTTTYKWQRCPVEPPESDAGCSDIGSGTSYTVTEADLGYRIQVVRTVKNVLGEDADTSPQTAVVTSANNGGGSDPTPTPTDPTPTPTDPTPTPTDPTPTPTDPTPTPTDPTPTPTDPTPTPQPPAKPSFTQTPGALTNKAYPEFAWTGDDAAGGSFQCRVTAGGLGDWYPDTGWTTCTSPAQTPPLTSGDYVFAVRQVTAGGVEGDPSYHVFTVDQEPPAKPELPSTQSSGTTASVNWLAGGGNEVITFECRLDDEPKESDGGWQPCIAPATFHGLKVGDHRLEIRAVDKAGNHSETVVATWTTKAPVVEEKPVEKPAEPKPVVETPAPVVVQTPAVEAPKPAPKAEEPKKETPKPVVTPVKPPALTAVIGGAKTGAQVGANGGTSSAATIEVAKEAVGVGCSITGTVLKSCKVDLYAPKASGARARAAAAEQVLVGTGTYESKSGSEKMDVRIELNATGKAMLRANPGGLKVTVKISGQPVSGAPLKATGVAKLVTDRAAATVGGFAVNSAVLTPAAKKQLRQLATFGKGATVRCVGHTDGSTDDARYLRELGQRRAKAVCAFLAAHGVKVGKTTLVTKGSSQPAATNATKAGRAKNRRVQVTLVR